MPFYETFAFKLFFYTAFVGCIISVVANYKLIRLRKPNNATFQWSTLLWGFLGWTFPILSTIVLLIITRNKD
jgi:hypothetical protein